MPRHLPFNIDDVLSGQYEAITSVGKVVDITSTDGYGIYKIRGKIKGHKKPGSWLINGRFTDIKPHSNDLLMRRKSKHSVFIKTF